MGMGSLSYLNNCGNVLNPKSQWLNTERTSSMSRRVQGSRQPSSILNSVRQSPLVRGRQLEDHF